MKTFHHGGRIGDLIFALYTMKKLGGGKLYVSDYHKPNWSLDIARSMESFFLHQEYVDSVKFIPYNRDLLMVDYNLQRAEDDFNPEKFPEWDGKQWPSNCNIRKRYAVHFDVPFEKDERWLNALWMVPQVDVAVHLPSYRHVRSSDDWGKIILGISEYQSISILGVNQHDDIQTSASVINSAKVFLGCVSSMNAIAEGLDKTRFIEQKEDCFNVNVPEGCCINGWSNEEVVRKVVEACRA